MPWKLKERIGISYESEASASYLILTASSSETVFDYQVEMIRSNSINGLLPMDMRQKDETLCFYYNITSKLSLSQFLKRRKLKRSQFIGMISAVTKTLLDCRGYLLYDRCVIIDADYIYISPDTLQVSMAYLPVDTKEDVNSRFKDFVIDLIINSANIDDSDSDNFLQRIINCLKADTFSIDGFYRLLMELTNVRIPPADADPGLDADAVKKVEAVFPVTDIEKNRDTAGKKSRSGIDGLLIPPAASPKSKGQKGKKPVKSEKAEGERHKSIAGWERTAVIIGGAVLQIIFLLIIIFGRNHLNSLNNDPVSFFMGFAVIDIGLCALIFRKLRDTKPEKVTKSEKDAKPAKGTKVEKGTKAGKGARPVKNAGKDVLKALNLMPEQEDNTKEEKWSMTGHLNEVYGSIPIIDEDFEKKEEFRRKKYGGTGNNGKGINNDSINSIRNINNAENIKGINNINSISNNSNIRDIKIISDIKNISNIDMKAEAVLKPLPTFGLPGLDDRQGGKRGETVLLESFDEKYPYLQPIKNGQYEKILITKKEFIIGRLRDQVDYTIENNAVGKVHAQISCSDNGICHIRDLNSRNGTFINHQRIKSNMDYELKSGDRVTFANSDYIFINPVTENRVFSNMEEMKPADKL